jgi:hypothetical protein
MRICGRSASAIALTMSTLLSSMPAQAHNAPVHSDMVELSYEVMLAVENKTFNFDPPPGVAPAEWTAFLDSVAAAPAKYRLQQSQLPAPARDLCLFPVSVNNFDPGAGWAQTTMGAVTHPVASTYSHLNVDCGVRPLWTPGGIFDKSNPPSPMDATKRDFTGTVLGFWSANVDSEFDDTHLWFRPTNTLGQGALHKFVNDSVSLSLAVIFAPLVCLFDLFAGHPETCLNDSKDLGDKANVVGTLEGLIPGFGDMSGDMWTGSWHHIKVIGPSSNSFDDREGLLIEEAGPFVVPDPVDLAIMIGTDTAGISVNFDKSNGPKRYQITNGGDSQPDTKIRDKGEWQSPAYAHTAFEPLDNLGLFGWKKFRSEAGHPVNGLGWPLHAIGDATVPMHVAATPAWGHRPFEDAQEKLWPELRLVAAEEGTQQREVKLFLTKAFEWRKFILAFRLAHPGDATQVPVREMITKLAQNTGAFALAQPPAQLWPFNPGASLVYLTSPMAATEVYLNKPNAAALYRPVVEDGVGATIAFLMSAAEVLQ